MKYADIDIKTARKCCKQHHQKSKNGKLIPNCKICPLRRTNPNGKTGFCWYELKALKEDLKDNNLNCDYLNAEYNALMQEDVKHLLEWENWINSQESLD